MLESLTCLSSSRQLIEFGSIWLFLSFIWAFAESTFLTMCGINIHSQHQQQKTRSKEKKMNFSTFLPTHKTWTKICCHFFPVSDEMKKKKEEKKLMRSEWAEKFSIHTPHSEAKWKKAAQQQNMMNYELLENVLFFTIFLLLHGKGKGVTAWKQQRKKFNREFLRHFHISLFFASEKKSFFGSLLWK